MAKFARVDTSQVCVFMYCTEQAYTHEEPHKVPLLITLSDGCYAQFPVIILPPISCRLAEVRLASLSFCRGWRVEGSMSRVEGNIFFPNFFFLEKVIIDAINVIKTNKKNLKNKWRGNIF